MVSYNKGHYCCVLGSDMIELALLALLETTPQAVEIEPLRETEFAGKIRTKHTERYQVVEVLPKEADSFDLMFSYAKPMAVIRSAYIHDFTIGGPESNALALGGQFGFQTAQYNGFSAILMAYTSQNLNISNFYSGTENSDLFSVDGKGFTYLSEANIAYSNAQFQVELGRVRVETPLANSDDTRMAPNTFEGIWSHIDLSGSAKAQAFYFSRWAGSGSQEVDNSGVVTAPQDEFKRFTQDSQGLMGISLSHVVTDNEYSLWYYYVDKYAQMLYAEALGEHIISDVFELEWGVQVSHFEALEGSSVQGTVSGALLLAHFESLFGGGAFNYANVAEGKTLTDGFGGGADFTSLDEASVATLSQLFPGKNIFAFRLGLGYEFSAFGERNLIVELMHGEFEVEGAPLMLDENDIIVSYQLFERWYGELVYANFHDNTQDDFDRAVARLDYRF